MRCSLERLSAQRCTAARGPIQIRAVPGLQRITRFRSRCATPGTRSASGAPCELTPRA